LKGGFGLIVAQIFNLPYRWFLTGNASKNPSRWKFSRASEFNSAIRQIANLRYGQIVRM
jgi:hypothetical protein